MSLYILGLGLVKKGVYTSYTQLDYRIVRQPLLVDADSGVTLGQSAARHLRLSIDDSLRYISF